MLHTGNPPQRKERHYLRVKGWKTSFQANINKKQAGVAILISNKIDFQTKLKKKKKKKRSPHLSFKSKKNPTKNDHDHQKAAK